jgi:hypothetical protein
MLRLQHYQYTDYKNSIKQIYEKSFPLSERFSIDIGNIGFNHLVQLQK